MRAYTDVGGYPLVYVDGALGCALCPDCATDESVSKCWLDRWGLTIAAQAEEIDRLKKALEQACETAEYLRADTTYPSKRAIREAVRRLETMRRNRAELLGDG